MCGSHLPVYLHVLQVFIESWTFRVIHHLWLLNGVLECFILVCFLDLNYKVCFLQSVQLLLSYSNFKIHFYFLSWLLGSQLGVVAAGPRELGRTASSAGPQFLLALSWELLIRGAVS